MKQGFWGVGLAAAMIVSPAVAQSSQTMLGKGEVALEVGGSGTSIRVADNVMFVCAIKTKADNADAARKALDEKRSDILFVANKSGASAQALDFSSSITVQRLQDWGADGYADEAAVAMAAASATVSKKEPDVKYAYFAHQNFTGNVSTIEQYQIIRALLKDCPDEPYLTLSNPDSARQEARQKALQAAQANAEASAAALNLKVVRMVRVSEVNAIEQVLGSDIVNVMRNEGFGRGRARALNKDGKIAITHSVTIEYVLAPK